MVFCPRRSISHSASRIGFSVFAPFDQPVTLEVYDEDLGWFFDRDDLIVKLKWAPPFAPLANQESLDNADYRVRAEL